MPLPSSAPSNAGHAQMSQPGPVDSKADAKSRPEDSPLWPLTVVLAEIATRIERCQANEHADLDDEAA
jgi:hypothetical protein